TVETFTTASDMIFDWADSTTLLTNGRVLLTGSVFQSDPSFLYEVYDPATGTYVNVGEMPTQHEQPTATLLLNGKVLIAGGFLGDSYDPSLNAELYDSTTGDFVATGQMTKGRYPTPATLLPDGTVLITGGYAVSDAEIYDPVNGVFSPIGNMVTHREWH